MANTTMQYHIRKAEPRDVKPLAELDARCFAAPWSEQSFEEDVVVCPVFDARREQVYSGAYTWNGTEAVSLVADGAYDLKEHLAQLQAAITAPAKVLFFGDGLDRYEALIRQWGDEVKEQGIEVEFSPVERRYQEAASIALLGRQMMEQGKAKQFGEMEPVYLRQAEAQRKLEERLAQMQ